MLTDFQFSDLKNALREVRKTLSFSLWLQPRLEKLRIKAQPWYKSLVRRERKLLYCRDAKVYKELQR